VILIPSRKEYFTVGLGSRLWWSYEELNSVKVDCHNEIRGLLNENANMTIRQALSLLYQPSMTGEEYHD
jgi:protein involved in temperature-dependent protein secretion